MLNFPGNSGQFFGENIEFFINKGVITFIQGEKCLAVRGTDPVKYIDSAYYQRINGGCLYFEKPAQLYTGAYEWAELSGTKLQIIVLFGSEKTAESFQKCFGLDYIKTGKITHAQDAIRWWNANAVPDVRLATSVCNWILEHEFHNIKNFKNREIAKIIATPPLPNKSYSETAKCYCEKNVPITALKEVFGYLWPLAKKQLTTGIYLNTESYYSSYPHCKCTLVSSYKYCFQLTDGDKIYTVISSGVRFDPKYPLRNSNPMMLNPVPPKVIPGAPWHITAPHDYKLNSRGCHLDVLKARGGSFFRADLEKFAEKNEMTMPFDTNALLDFVYVRVATITNAKKEIALARYVQNTDYENYIFNHLAATDLYHYYKYK